MFLIPLVKTVWISARRFKPAYPVLDRATTQGDVTALLLLHLAA